MRKRLSTVNDHLWWQRGVIYQVYPRSFADSNGDGIGDLGGIIDRLEHLAWLGVDAAWLSPIFPSPMVDFGYDVADYTDIDPRFGDLAQFDELLRDAHAREIRIILDFVPNHTSDRHPWFAASRSSRNDPKREWYLWRDPASDGGPPNNWLSEFGGSAWELDQRSGQFYYHAFAKEQPDLNWRNPAVQRAMLYIMRFWLDRGVDGFRVDVIWHLIKDDRFRDNPSNPDYREGIDAPHRALLPAYSTDQPPVHEIVARMRALLDQYDERVMIGEVYLPIDRLVAYYGGERPGAHMPFNFHLVATPWNAREIEVIIDRYEGALPDHAWPNWVLGNHDTSRVASRIGPEQARVAAMLLLSLRGTPTVYYGDEIGMRDVEIPSERAVDVAEENEPGYGLGRDPQRTPMQWDGSAGAGFSGATPWLPIAADADRRNVERQRDDPRSMLTLYRRLLALRRAEAALSIGSYAPIPALGDVLAYLREADGTRLLAVLNLGGETAQLETEMTGEVLLSTSLEREGERLRGPVDLRPNEGLVLRVDP